MEWVLVAFLAAGAGLGYWAGFYDATGYENKTRWSQEKRIIALQSEIASLQRCIGRGKL